MILGISNEKLRLPLPQFKDGKMVHFGFHTNPDSGGGEVLFLCLLFLRFNLGHFKWKIKSTPAPSSKMRKRRILVF